MGTVSILVGLVILIILGTVLPTFRGKRTDVILPQDLDTEENKRSFETLEDAQKYAEETDAEILQLRKQLVELKNEVQDKQTRMPWFKFAFSVLFVVWVWQGVSDLIGLIVALISAK